MKLAAYNHIAICAAGLDASRVLETPRQDMSFLAATMVHRSSTCIPPVSTPSRGSLEQPSPSESDMSTSTTWEDEITPSEGNMETKNDDVSIDRAYQVASLARARLQRVIERPDHDLRLLIGHANLLDHLMERIEEIEPGFTFERLEEMHLEALTPSPTLPNKPLRRSPIEDVLQRIDWSEDDGEDEFLDDEVYDESDDELEEPQKEVFDDVKVTVTPVVLCHERAKGVVRKPRKHDPFGRVIPFLERLLKTSTILSQSSSNCHHR